MAGKRKSFYYVLVMGQKGPVFVTDVNHSDKTAEWDMDGKPFEFGSESYAMDITMGLNLNFIGAFMVKSKFEIESHPYRYNDGNFKWEWKENAE